MALSDAAKLLIVVLIVLCTITVLLASAVLLWHRWWSAREARTSREGHVLALEYAKFLTGRLDAATLRETAARTQPEVFWAAIETFADNVDGEEWTRLSGALGGLAHVARERERLESARPWARALAARHLGMIDEPDNREPLRRAMARGPSTVTLMATLALARIHDHAALAWFLDHADSLEPLSRHQLIALIKRFGRDALPTLRFGLAAADFARPSGLAAIEVLGLWRDLESRETLEGLLAEGGLEARVAAARALGHLGIPEAVPSLHAALADPEWQVRAQAARSLGELRAPEQIDALAASLRDVSWWVRRNAAYAIGELGEPGERRLREVARLDPDRFAISAAREVLQALEWERESPGGVSRVG